MPFTASVSIAGLDVSTPHLKRTELVEKLRNLVNDNKVVLVSAPMGSGKTSLLTLFGDKYKNAFKYYYRTMVQTSPDMLLSQFGIIASESRLDESSLLLQDPTCPTILMLDDCQQYYSAGYAQFWELVAKSLKFPTNVHLVISATRSVSYSLESPVSFAALPKLTREDFMLTEVEASELLKMNAPVGLALALRCPNFMHVVVKECNGLIAALRISISSMNATFRLAEDKCEATLLHYFFSENMVRNYDRCYTAQADHIAPEVIPLLVQLLTTKTNITATSGVGMEPSLLLRYGILTEKNNMFEFASPLASRFITRLLFPNRASASELPTSLKSFVKSSIGKLSASALYQSVQQPDKPKEAVYQHLFMQAMHACSPASVMVCPELSRVFPGADVSGDGNTIAGELDFYLNGDLRWGIELLVGGSDIGEHMFRFSTGGKYAALLVKDYVVLDFRKGPVTNIKRFEHRTTVFFNDNFIKCTVLEGFSVQYIVDLAA